MRVEPAGRRESRVIVYGINPVLEALRAGRVTTLRVGERGGDRMRELVTLAQKTGDLCLSRVSGVLRNG